jgi:hypothetical protein
MGAGLYFDFSTLSFHVPIVLSAPKAVGRVLQDFIKTLQAAP